MSPDRDSPAGRLARSLLALSARLYRRHHAHLAPREWSNRELRRVAPYLAGDILNASGWRDEDKEGDHYARYFPKATRYVVSNIPGARGLTGASEEITLDLLKPLPPQVAGSFDVVLSHTVLEHVPEPFTALDNLSRIARKALVIVVPFIQVEHYETGSYLDYTRFTPIGIAAQVESRGFRAVRVTTNRNPVFPTYVFCLATRAPFLNEIPADIQDRTEIDRLPGTWKPVGDGPFLA